jgi:glycosyltransferase involved in cell wall biosynthesis
MNPIYSVIIPVYNLVDSLAELVKRIDDSFNSISKSYEIIFVDDGSENIQTLVKMKELQELYSTKISIISLFTNSGQQSAILCGLKESSGDFILTLDGDLEHRPEDIINLIDNLDGNDIVFGIFKTKTHGPIKKLFSSIYTSIERFALKYPKGTKRSAFWLMTKDLSKIILEFNTLYPNISIMSVISSKKIASTEVVQGLRTEGESQWTFLMLLRLASSLFINNTSILLRLYAFIGVVLSLISFIYGSYLIYIKLFTYNYIVPGTTAIFVSILFFSGILILGTSLLGEYLVRILQNIERKPLYIIRSKFLRK